ARSRPPMARAKRASRCGVHSMHTFFWLWTPSKKPPVRYATGAASLPDRQSRPLSQPGAEPWGAAVMIASGAMLWANNLVLRFLPKSWLDAATSVHFYEAL